MLEIDLEAPTAFAVAEPAWEDELADVEFTNEPADVEMVLTVELVAACSVTFLLVGNNGIAVEADDAVVFCAVLEAGLESMNMVEVTSWEVVVVVLLLELVSLNDLR